MRLPVLRLTFASVLLFAASAAAQDPLGPARDLYAAAEYEEALTTLVRLKAEAIPASGTEIDRYRVLCLIALGRASEADRVIESIVMNDPLYQPAPGDAAPRVRAAFSTVRQRVLPRVARTLYVDAKAAFDRKAYPEAAQALEKTVNVIDNIEGANQAELGDLRVLAAGFLDLSRASLAPAPPPAVPAALPASSAKSGPMPATAAPSTTNLAVLKQELPPVPFSLATVPGVEYRGTIEVDIDEAGNVITSRMVQRVHPLYDPVLLRASRNWKYEPPRVAGKPIASRKRVEIVLKP